MRGSSIVAPWLTAPARVRLSPDELAEPGDQDGIRLAGITLFNREHGFPDPYAQDLEEFRAKAGLPAPSAEEVAEWNAKRAEHAARP